MMWRIILFYPLIWICYCTTGAFLWNRLELVNLQQVNKHCERVKSHLINKRANQYQFIFLFFYVFKQRHTWPTGKKLAIVVQIPIKINQHLLRYFLFIFLFFFFFLLVTVFLGFVFFNRKFDIFNYFPTKKILNLPNLTGAITKLVSIAKNKTKMFFS